MLTLTWCHSTPAETPTGAISNIPIYNLISALFSGNISAVCVEDDLHSVALGLDCWWLEVPGMQWINIGVTAALMHQDCPVPINDFEKVARAGGDIVSTGRNRKVGELQP